MSIHFVSGDIFLEKVIVHQCNCLTTNSRGFAQALFEKFPYANIYDIHPRRQGDVYIVNDPDAKGPIAIGIMAQYYPGGPKGKDDRVTRLKYFKEGLDTLTRDEYPVISVPEKIGCSLAQGKWEDYLSVLKEFALSKEIEVRIFRRV